MHFSKYSVYPHTWNLIDEMSFVTVMIFRVTDDAVCNKKKMQIVNIGIKRQKKLVFAIDEEKKLK